MFKEVVLMTGLSAGVLLGQSFDKNNPEYPELYKKLFSAPITNTLHSYNYVESYQDNNYLSSTLFQKLVDGEGVLGNVTFSHDKDNGWKGEYGIGIDQEVLSSDKLYAELYCMPFWYNKNGRIKGQKIIGAYVEVYPIKNAVLYMSIDYNIDKKINLSSVFLNLDIGF